MENYCAKLDTLKKVITFNYEGENFEVDLTEGDLEDSWNSIQMKDGSIRDINFSWQENTGPCFSVYLIEENEDGSLATLHEEGSVSLNIIEVTGTREEYFKEPEKPMKAVLVTFDFMVRVIVKEGASEETITSLAKDKLQGLKREWEENVVAIEEDKECPFGTFEMDREEL